MDSNLSKVSTDAKANPEFIKLKRREMPYSKDNHIIYVSTVRNTTLQSPFRAHGATWSRMRVSASSWEYGWRYSTSPVSFCVETIVSSFVLMITFLPCSFASMFTIEQIANPFISVSIIPQESLPVRRNRCSRTQALSLRSATVRSTTLVDCFRLC